MSHLWLALFIYGLAIIIAMLAAVLIKGIVVGLSLTQQKPKASLPAPAAPRNLAQDDIVVIAAAVYAMLGPHRIVHIESTDRGRLWTAIARTSHYSSHAIQHHHRR